tara:strand:- start:196 stop:477 length:282 start_codon:yes stop_codon:yes gene_type:complete
MMPLCCSNIHVGWICPSCGKPISIKPHSGNDPVPIGKLTPPQVTVVQGDYIHGSVIKDSVVMGDVPAPNVQGDEAIKIKPGPVKEITDEVLLE